MPQLMAAHSIDQRVYFIHIRKHPGDTHRSHYPFTAPCLQELVDRLVKGKGKAVPLQAGSGPEGSRKLRFPDYVTMAQDGGKVVSLTQRPSFSPGNTPGNYLC